MPPSSMDDHNDDNEDDREGDASRTMTALNAKTIAMIATRARCQEALSFLHYVKRVLAEKGDNAAAVAAAGHGWDWVEDNCRLGRKIRALRRWWQG